MKFFGNDGRSPGRWRLFGVLLVFFGFAQQWIGIHHGDKEWLLLAAKTQWRGGVFYRTVFELNPPLILWLYAVPAGIALILPIFSAYHMLLLLGGVSSLGIIALCERILAFHPFFHDEEKKLQCRALLCFLLFLYPDTIYFWDREHILFALTLPYVFRFMPSLDKVAMDKAALPWRLRVASGALAAVGFCIKPQGFLVLASLQLFWLLRSRSWRALLSLENGIICIGALIYLASIILLTPDYLTLVLPMALATHQAYHQAFQYVYFYSALFFLTLCFLLGETRPRDATPLRADLYWLLALCGGYFMYMCCNSGWNYTFHPLFSASFLLAGFLFWEFRWLGAGQTEWTRFDSGAWICRITLVLAGLCSLTATGFALRPCREGHCLCVALLEKSAQGARAFGAMAIDFSPWPEVENHTGARFVTRFNHLWMMPKLFIADAAFRQENAWIPAYVADAYAQDLIQNRPELFYVDASPLFNHADKPVDLIAYFKQYSDFKAAFAPYRLMETIDTCAGNNIVTCRYKVYRRKDAS
jgi:hypothetical protein